MIHNSQHSFAKFRNIISFKEFLLDSMHKKPNDIYKNFTKFKDVNPRTKENEDLKANVLDNVGDLLNDSYYIYKERYEEEKNTLSKKDTQKIDNTK